MTEHAPTHHHSSDLEKILEHRFVSELTTCLWLNGSRDIEVLRSEVDSSGHDLVVEANGILRHIQLKSMVKGGKKSRVTINTRLASKPGGCVIWYDYDPDTLELGPFRWFGTLPGLGLPDLGDEVAKHSKGDATGAKNERTGHRVLRKGRFHTVDSIADLLPLLFGYDRQDQRDLLSTNLLGRPGSVDPAWLHEVSAGRFAAIPDNLCWDDSCGLAHLIDGYELAREVGLGDPFEFEQRQLDHALQTRKWLGGPAVLWITLFLEHRRWRMAPIEPDPAMEALLDKLCRQLAVELKGQRSTTR